MVAVRSMLARVQKLEVEKVHPLLALMGGEGGWATFEAETDAGIADGRYDSRDMLAVLAGLRRWIADTAWCKRPAAAQIEAHRYSCRFGLDSSRG